MDKIKNINETNLRTFANCVKSTINAMDCDTTGELGKCVYSITLVDGVVSYEKTDTINNANKWTTGRTITLGEDCTGSVTIDGSLNVTLNVTVNDDSHNHVLSNIDGITASLAELNILDGATLNTTELNYVDGVTSSIQTQLDGKAPKSHASSATTYGLGTTSNYGHVKISNGDVASVTAADGLVAGMDHSHSNYMPKNTTQTNTGVYTFSNGIKCGSTGNAIATFYKDSSGIIYIR